MEEGTWREGEEPEEMEVESLHFRDGGLGALGRAFQEQCRALRVRAPQKVQRRVEDAGRFPHALHLQGVEMSRGCLHVLLDTLRSVRTVRLSEVCLDFVKIGPRGARYIGEMLRDPGCRLLRLSLVHTALGDEGGADICQDLGTLEKLDLADNALTARSAQVLALYFDSHKASHLTFLRLDRNNIGDRAGELLFHALDGCSHLEEVCLAACGLSFATATAFLQARLPRLRAACFRHNAIARNKQALIDDRLRKAPRGATRRAPHGARDATREATRDAATTEQARTRVNAGLVLESVLHDLRSESSGRREEAAKQLEDMDALSEALQDFALRCNDPEGRSLARHAAERCAQSERTMRHLHRTLAMYKTASNKVLNKHANARNAMEHLARKVDNSSGHHAAGVPSVLEVVERLEGQLREKQHQIDQLLAEQQSLREANQAALAEQRSGRGPRDATSASSESPSTESSTAGFKSLPSDEGPAAGEFTKLLEEYMSLLASSRQLRSRVNGLEEDFAAKESALRAKEAQIVTLSAELARERAERARLAEQAERAVQQSNGGPARPATEGQLLDLVQSQLQEIAALREQNEDLRARLAAPMSPGSLAARKADGSVRQDKTHARHGRRRHGRHELEEQGEEQEEKVF